MNDKELKTKVSSAIGTIYFLFLGALTVLYKFFLEGTILGIIFVIAIPIIAALILIEVNLKKIKPQINKQNYPIVKKSVIYLMVLIGLFCFISDIVTLISHIIATCVILNFLNPKK